jgi:hypothetical protein
MRKKSGTGIFSKTMKQTLILILFALAMPVHGDNSPVKVDPFKLVDPAFSKEIGTALTEIETIKPGQTRRDLLKLFSMDGGLTSRSVTRYLYLRCEAIKVDVTFEKVGDPTEKFPFNPDDKIITISKPYLEWPFLD